MYDVYNTIPEFLIALAQNDYMINHHFLPDGKTLYQAAADVEALEALVKDYETRLTTVILPDYKDWHDNAKTEWPEVAAATITSLREQADFFREAFDRADARVAELEAAGRTVVNMDTAVMKGAPVEAWDWDAAMDALKAVVGMGDNDA